MIIFIIYYIWSKYEYRISKIADQKSHIIWHKMKSWVWDFYFFFQFKTVDVFLQDLTELEL